MIRDCPEKGRTGGRGIGGRGHTGVEVLEAVKVRGQLMGS
jgi:hypothetical protein